MTLIAGLFKQCRGEGRRLSQQELNHLAGLPLGTEVKKNPEKEEAKRRAKREKAEARERLKREEEEQHNAGNRPKRVPFDFEKVQAFFSWIKG
jgi:hypothetical protein